MKRSRIARSTVALLVVGLLSACSPTTGGVSSATSVAPAISVTGTRSVEPGMPGSSLLGSPTNSGISINTLASAGMQLVVNYGTTPDSLTFQTPVQTAADTAPVVTIIDGLEPDTRYYYAVAVSTGEAFNAAPVQSFMTMRNAGETFSFGVQGDSHPERDGKMFDAVLYQQNATNASSQNLDFYFMMGDDFSIDKLIQDGTVSQQSVDERYLLQRSYLDPLGSSTPIFTVNGNHEQAAKYLLDGTLNNPAVYAGAARYKFFPLPEPNEFYSVDQTQVDGVGYLKDYYAFQWGDALFVVIDPYWHSDSAVDNSASDSAPADSTSSATKGGGKKKASESTPVVKGKGKKQTQESSDSTSAPRNLWNNTLGNDQYQWLLDTLRTTTATYKFVFTHHVLGTGRGGIEEASLYEWGGYDKNGDYSFPVERPDWEAPIADLMAENNVTIFFQGHDHLFAQQELNGVTYQTVPSPADPTATAFNSDAYKSGTILPNSGFLKVTVGPNGVTVDYIATGGSDNGEAIYSYNVGPSQ